MNDGDVRLTDEELRIIAEIERGERSRRATRRSRLRTWVSRHRLRRRSAVSWTFIITGIVVIGIGLVLGQPVVGLAGFVVALRAIAQRCRAITPASFAAGIGRFIGVSAPSDP